MHPVDITWVEDGGLERSSGMLNINNNLFRKTGDFNGDGKADLLVINGVLNTYNGELLGTSNTFKIFDVSKKNISDQYTILLVGSLPYNNISAILIGDVDSDGDDDIVFQTKDKTYTHTTGTCSVTGSTFQKWNLISNVYSYRALISNVDKNLKTFNLNVSRKYDYYPSRKVVFSNNYVTSEAQMNQFSLVIPTLVEADGDGSLDLLERETTGTRVVLIKESGIFTSGRAPVSICFALCPRILALSYFVK